MPLWGRREETIVRGTVQSESSIHQSGSSNDCRQRIASVTVGEESLALAENVTVLLPTHQSP